MSSDLMASTRAISMILGGNNQALPSMPPISTPTEFVEHWQMRLKNASPNGGPSLTTLLKRTSGRSLVVEVTLISEDDKWRTVRTCSSDLWWE